MFETSDPKQPFYVANQVDLFPQDLCRLIKLYEPIVGGRAVALYLTLLEDYNPRAILSDSKGIYTLQEELDCSLRNLFTSLHRLEGVGLVKTYLVENTVNQILAFKLQKVGSAQEFFATDLLASLLKEKVGPVVFNDLSHYFASVCKAKNRDIKNAKDISANFLDAFSLPSNEVITPSDDVIKAAQDNQIKIASSAQVNDKVDWDYINQQFTLYQVAPGEVDKNKDQIRSLMQTYGLTEQDFVNESLMTLHGSNKLNMREIANTLADDYRLQATRTRMQQELDQEKTPQVPTDLPTGTKEVWQEANRLSPAEFLYKIKSQAGGFVDSHEKQTVNRLHTLYGLPTDLVNILSYVCLKNTASINSNYINTIANDWLQHGVKNSADALKYWTNREDERKKKRQSRSTYRPQKRVEQGTDWSKKKANTNKNVNPEELKNFFKNFEDQNGMK